MQTKQQITLTEQRLCKMWTATSYGGDWYELNKTLWEIAQVLRAEGMAEQTEVFAFCAAIALQRAVDETQKRQTNAFESAINDAVARGETLGSTIKNLVDLVAATDEKMVRGAAA